MIKQVKLLITALLLFCTLLIFVTTASADYTTDGDDSTAVDYIVMNAEQIKAASGTKGTVILDENKYMVAKYTAAESWYTNGRLNIIPANSGAGFASTGENSLFDFPYYVVHYKTTSNALTYDTTDLMSWDISKWLGQEQITKSTNYTFKTIKRDTFTSGSDGTSTPLDNTKYTQQISLKMFPSADVDGYIYIESIAAFRTEAQAEDFKANYTPKAVDYTTDGNDATSVDYIVMDPADIKASSGTKGEITTDENGYEVVKYTATETSQPWATVNIKPADSDAGFAATGENSLFDFPYYVVHYKTTSGALSADTTNLMSWDISKWLGQEQITKSTDYTYKTIKRDTFTSGSDGTSTPLDNTKYTQQISLKMFPSADDNEYIYIESIAAFRTEEQAKAFKLIHVPSYPETEDYTTDMNPTTGTDYLIMHEDDIKLASGENGVIFTEADGNKVVKYTAAESCQPWTMLSITPANSNAGFAVTGENSLFDFPYYVVRYKTTATGVGYDTTNLVGGSVYKWGGNDQIRLMTEYGYKTIRRDTFKNGSDSTTIPLDNTKTNQTIGLKVFDSSDVEGSLYIDLIAAFRTEKQAELFISDYVPEAPLDTTKQLVLIADALNGTVKNNAFEKNYIYDDEEGKAYVKFVATADGTHVDSSQFEFNFESNELTAGYPIKEYPYVKISYSSNIANTGARIDMNLGVTYLGSKTRLWGYSSTYSHDESFNSVIFDASSVFTDGEGITDYSFDNVDAESVCNYIRLKPWFSGDINKDEYFAVEYIGFFKTLEDAQAYEYKIDKTLIGIKLDSDIIRLFVGDTAQAEYTPTPSYADLSNISFDVENDAVATVDENGLITAKSVGQTTVTITDESSEISATIVVTVQENSPLDWYEKSSEDGDAVVINVLGDSISYGAGATSTYHSIWANDFKMTVNNWSVGGSAITGDYKDTGNLIETFVPRMERMVASSDEPDMLVIYGGTNDYNGNWTIGKPGDLTRDTFCGAISELIMLSWKNYPEAKLVFFTPIKRADYATGEGNDNTGNRRYELDAYVDAMLETCAYYGVDCIDLYNNEQANFTGLRTTYINDGVHLTDEGHRIFSKIALEEMEKAEVVATHGYTAAPAPTYTLDADRDLSTQYHIFDAATLDTLTTYTAGSLLDRQRMSKHSLVNGALRFSAETLTSKLAPTVAVNFAALDFAITDYPYMSVVYKTDSTAANIDVQLRGADNHVSTIAELPALTSAEKAGFYVNVKDYESDDIVLTGDTINSDLYMTLAFFEDTYSMSADSYVDIESIAFFKSEALAKSYAENHGIVTNTVSANAVGNGSITIGDDTVKNYTDTVTQNTTLTLTATADTGYRLEGWYEVTDGRNILLSRDTTYVHTVDSDVEIEARFIDETISIAVKLVASTSEGGFISVNGNTFEDYNDYANSGSAVELTAVADTGYTFAYWKRVSCSTGTEIYLGVDET
ncbi:MAG: Ig-like domain-containing protein, partial [Clostridia bacterium]|nr:Ig-like domain-containing protein [Clostridia bacterium]